MAEYFIPRQINNQKEKETEEEESNQDIEKYDNLTEIGEAQNGKLTRRCAGPRRYRIQPPCAVPSHHRPSARRAAHRHHGPPRGLRAHSHYPQRHVQHVSTTSREPLL